MNENPRKGAGMHTTEQAVKYTLQVGLFIADECWSKLQFAGNYYNEFGIKNLFQTLFYNLK